MKTQIITLLWCCIGMLGFGQSITDIEYFYNTDPGFGNGTAVTVNTNTGTLTQTVSLPVGSSLSGFNTLYLRAKDDNNTWSLYDNRVFYVTELASISGATNITAAEYFFNTDPGFGNATAISVDSNSGELTQTVSLPVGNTLTGFNTLYIRTQDDLGTWSLYDTRVFYITNQEAGTGATTIAAAEYFFNTDPGFGNGTSISVDANTGDLTQVLALNIGNLEGFNNLYIRTQDDLGVWSLYDKRLFYISEDQIISNITAAEYFYDTDPGFGNGTPATLTATGNPDEFTVELATTDVTCDFHDFYIRLQNADGTWSLYDYDLQIEVFDNANPTIVTFPNITAELDATGNTSITIADVDNGTFDDCELVSVVLNQTQFNYTCANLGANTVTITATDAEAKVSSEDVTITVEDNINPVAVSQDITIQLDASGTATITPSQIENGSTDNCAVTGFSLDKTSFDCSNLGTNTVTLTVSDASGNTNATTATVTIGDTVKPTVNTQPVTVQLDANGNASVTATAVDNNSTDNCTIANTSIDINSFDCSNLGTNTVTLTVTDQSGNSETGTAIVTVEDSISPTVVTQNITVQLDASGTASFTASQIENGSTDNCSISSSSLDISSFDCDDLGVNTVILSVTDQSNNTSTNSALVTVEDNVNPVAITKNSTVQLDASGNATITANDVDNNSTDNCSIVSKSLDVSSFTCANIGANTVMLTVEDSSGNTNTTSAVVTVEDNVNPTVLTKNFTVELDASGTVNISTSDIENGSTDACGIASSSLDISSFDCNDLGTNTVALSVTDTNGNTGTNTAVVTVVDEINPVAITKNITVQLDASGNATITGNDIDDNSSDNCGIVSKNVDIPTFTCDDLGTNTTTLSVEDASGNTDTEVATVTIVDTIDPVAIGQDIVKDLNGNTSVTILASELDNGSSDNCGYTLSIDVDTFAATGVYPVVLTVTDASGNSDSATVNVTVVDGTLNTAKPEISGKNLVLYPVPSEDFVYISTPLIIDSVTLYDVNGKAIKTMDRPKIKIDITGINTGVYFLKFNIENRIITKRIIKK